MLCVVAVEAGVLRHRRTEIFSVSRQSRHNNAINLDRVADDTDVDLNT